MMSPQITHANFCRFLNITMYFRYCSGRRNDIERNVATPQRTMEQTRRPAALLCPLSQRFLFTTGAGQAQEVLLRASRSANNSPSGGQRWTAAGNEIHENRISTTCAVHHLRRFRVGASADQHYFTRPNPVQHHANSTSPCV